MARSLRILIAADDRSMREVQERICTQRGHAVTAVADGAAALAALTDAPYDVVLADLDTPGHDAMGVLEHAHRVRPEAAVVLSTGGASPEATMEALRLGATELLLTPVTSSHLEAILDRLVVAVGLREDHARLSRLAEPVAGGGAMVGDGARMRTLRELIATVGPTDSTVLITGEPGSGKELVARGVHAHSERRGGPFVAVRCAAIAPSAVERELFGHEAGAFPGANQRRIGLVEAAQGGSVFLDEIGALDPGAQNALLRALQEREVTRVGGTTPVGLDVRVLAATSRDLRAAVAAGRFREDLWYRINVFPIEVPPLRERLDDLAALATHFLAEAGTRHARPGLRLGDAAILSLRGYAWPGNVRELQHVLERAALLCDGTRIEPHHLPLTRDTDAAGRPRPLLPWKRALADFESEYVRRALELTGGNVSAAAKLAGIDRSALYAKVRKLQVDPREYRDDA